MKKILLSSILSMVLAGSLCATDKSNTKNSNYSGILPQGEKVLLDETFVIAKDYNSKPLVIDKVLISSIPGSNGKCKLQIDSTRYEHTEAQENGLSILIAKDTVRSSNQRTHTFLCPGSASANVSLNLFRYSESPKNTSNPDTEIQIFAHPSSAPKTAASDSIQTILSYTKATEFTLAQKNDSKYPNVFRQYFVVETSFKDSL